MDIYPIRVEGLLFPDWLKKSCRHGDQLTLIVTEDAVALQNSRTKQTYLVEVEVLPPRARFASLEPQTP